MKRTSRRKRDGKGLEGRPLTVTRHVTAGLAMLVASCRGGTAPPPSESEPLTPAAAPASEGSGSRPGCQSRFAEFDDDDDGFVTRDEFLRHPHARPEPLAVFDGRDTNRDGKLTESELCSRRGSGATMGARCYSQFDTFDGDGDGRITAEEFAARPHPRGDARSLFEARDRNDDGHITRDEFCSSRR